MPSNQPFQVCFETHHGIFYPHCNNPMMSLHLSGQNASTSIPMVVHFIIDKIRGTKAEIQPPEIHDQTMYRSCPTDLPKVLRVDIDETE